MLDQIYEIFRLRDSKYSFREIAKYAKCSKSRACEIYNHEVLTKTKKKLPWHEKAKLAPYAISVNLRKLYPEDYRCKESIYAARDLVFRFLNLKTKSSAFMQLSCMKNTDIASTQSVKTAKKHCTP